MAREYLISPRDRKYSILYSSPDLDQVAQELAGRPDRASLDVDASEGMGYRSALTDEEKARLAAALG